MGGHTKGAWQVLEHISNLSNCSLNIQTTANNCMIRYLIHITYVFVPLRLFIVFTKVD